MKVFDDLAGQEAITADDAFTLVATYGFPIELAQELAEERGQALDMDGFARPDGAAPRGLARRRRGHDAAAARRSSSARASAATEFVGYSKTDVLTAVIDTCARGTARASSSSSSRARSTPPAAAR